MPEETIVRTKQAPSFGIELARIPYLGGAAPLHLAQSMLIAHKARFYMYENSISISWIDIGNGIDN